MMTDTMDFLHPRRCCVLVIDPQENLMKAIHKAERVVRNSALMIHCARTMGIPLLATAQYRKGLGPFVPELQELLQDVPCIDKMEFNALAAPDMVRMLATLPSSVDTLLMTGVEAHICVHQTALGAMRLGYRPWIVADAVSSRKKRNTRFALQRLQALGATVGPAEMAVYELLARAGTPEFKALLPHLK